MSIGCNLNVKLNVLLSIERVIKEKTSIIFTVYNYIGNNSGIKTASVIDEKIYNRICEIIQECGYIVDHWKIERTTSYGINRDYFVIIIEF